MEKNLFPLLSGAAGKSFINEMTRMINAWFYDTPVIEMAFEDLA